MPQDPTFLSKEKHIKKQMNFLEQEIEDFKQIKKQKNNNQVDLKHTNTNREELKPARRKWLNNQIKKNKEEMKQLKKKLEKIEEGKLES